MTQLTITVTDPQVAEHQLEDLMSDLQAELLDLDVDSVEPGKHSAPEGTRGVEALELATLVVQFAIESHLVQLVAEKITSWVRRRHVEGVDLTIGTARLRLPTADSASARDAIGTFVQAAVDAQRRS